MHISKVCISGILSLRRESSPQRAVGAMPVIQTVQRYASGTKDSKII